MRCGAVYSRYMRNEELTNISIHPHTHTHTHTHTHIYIYILVGRERELRSSVFNNYFFLYHFQSCVLFYLNFLFISNCYACTENVNMARSHYPIQQGSLMITQTFIEKPHIITNLSRIQFLKK